MSQRVDSRALPRESPFRTFDEAFAWLAARTNYETMATQRYDARSDTAYLLRPDQHIAARWRQPSLADISSALRCAQGIR